MSRPALPSWTRRRALLAASVVVLGVVAIVPAASQASAVPHASRVSAKPAATIDTYRDWDHGAFVAPFGRRNTATYGQLITVPVDETELVRFRFWMRPDAPEGRLVLRGEVYAWDGTMATGPAIWEGAARTFAFHDALFHRVGFHVGGVPLTGGAQYVLFASISKDYEEATKGYTLSWPAVPDDSYEPGTFVFLNNRGDESRWTSHFWHTTGLDTAVKVWLRPPS